MNSLILLFENITNKSNSIGIAPMIRLINLGKCILIPFFKSMVPMYQQPHQPIQGLRPNATPSLTPLIVAPDTVPIPGRTIEPIAPPVAAP